MQSGQTVANLDVAHVRNVAAPSPMAELAATTTSCTQIEGSVGNPTKFTSKGYEARVEGTIARVSDTPTKLAKTKDGVKLVVKAKVEPEDEGTTNMIVDVRRAKLVVDAINRGPN